MTDLDAAIRGELDQFCESDICAEKGKAALLAVLDEHPLGRAHNCVEDITVSLWYEGKPCPTLLAVAKGLGVVPAG